MKLDQVEQSNTINISKLLDMKRINAIGRLSSINGSSQDQIINFILQLSYSKNLDNFALLRLEKYFPSLKTGFVKSKIFSSKLRLSQENTDDISFLNKKQLIQRINTIQLAYIFSGHQEEIDALTSEKWQLLPLEAYLQLFTKYTQVNSFKVKRQTKYQLCLFFANKFLNIAIKHNFQELLNKCLIFVMEWIEQNTSNITNTIFKVIQNTLTSVVLLQTVSEQRLRTFLLLLMTATCDKILKIRLYFHIFSCMEWILLRYQSKYRYQFLMDSLFQAVHSNINNHQKDEPSQLLNLLKIYITITDYEVRHQQLFKYANQLFFQLSFQLTKVHTSNNQTQIIKSEIFLCFFSLYIRYKGSQRETHYFYEEIFTLLSYQLNNCKIISCYFFIWIDYLVEHMKINVIQSQIKGIYQIFSEYSFFQCFKIVKITQIHMEAFTSKKKVGSNVSIAVKSQINKLKISNLSIIKIESIKYRSYQKYWKVYFKFERGNFETQNILAQLRELNSYKHHHEHAIVQHYNDVCEILEIYLIKLGVCRSYEPEVGIAFDQIYKFASQISCFSCKKYCMVISNRYRLSFTKSDKRWQYEDYYLRLIIGLINENSRVRIHHLIFQLMEKMVSYFGKENYFVLMYDWFKSIKALSSYILTKHYLQYNAFQVHLLLFYWNRQPDVYFEIIFELCAFMETNSYLEPSHFVDIIKQISYYFMQHFQPFFHQNYDKIISNIQTYGNNRYLALYLAVLLQPPTTQYTWISLQYFKYIWSQYHRLDIFSKSLINFYLYPAYLNKCKQFATMKERNLNYIRTISIRSPKQSVVRGFIHDAETVQCMRNNIKKLKKVKGKITDSTKHMLLVKKIKTLYQLK